MDKACYIFGAGDYFGLYSRPVPGDEIIAADGGYYRCMEEGLIPTLLVGDFDSAPRPNFAGETVVLPVEKDDTDMVFAAKCALARDCKRIYIYGGTGGRADHTMANIQTLLYIRKRGAYGVMYGKNQTAAVIIGGDAFSLPARDEGILSVFCLGDRAEGVSIRGLKYPLTDAVLTADFPLGVSNHFTGSQTEVTVRSGALLIVYDNERK